MVRLKRVQRNTKILDTMYERRKKEEMGRERKKKKERESSPLLTVDVGL